MAATGDVAGGAAGGAARGQIMWQHCFMFSLRVLLVGMERAFNLLVLPEHSVS